MLGADRKVAVRGFAIEIAPSIIQHHGEILDSNDEAALATAIKQEQASECEEQMEVDEYDHAANGASRNANEADLEADNETRKRTRKKARQKKTPRDDEVRRIGLQNGILTFLLRCCIDKSPLIRARALTQVAVLLNDARFRNKLSEISKNPIYPGDEDAAENPISGPRLLSIIVERCMDARVSARKAALVALEALFPNLSELEKTEVLQVYKVCLFSNDMVRKKLELLFCEEIQY
ncbi:unnamed protein product [Gongylonema pulchrum]|uniref:Condensin complex subunit 1 n=1 Tax=Gongylonema pulchrum TaxID=637853 RepID=A0A183EBM4_9BILA|nr:unnamed protein product [Gongylonema pulchrum]